MEMAMQDDNKPKEKQSSLHTTIIPMAIVAMLFFILGFATWLNGSLMPFLKQILDLTPLQASLILFSFYIAVTFTAIPSSQIVRKIGYKKGMALGMAIMMIAGLLFIPAAKTQIFAVFLFAQLVMGTGQTLLQAGVNPYVVKIGPEESAAARVCIMGILNKGAGICAPLAFYALVLSDFEQYKGIKELTDIQVSEMAGALIYPYLGLAIFLGLLAFAVFKSPLPELISEEEAQANKGQIRDTLSHPNLVLGVAALFFYVAVEVIAGDTIGTYALSLGVDNYAVMTSYTMACMVIGYILGIILTPRVMSQSTALAISSVLGITLSIFIVFGSTESMVISNTFSAPAMPDALYMIAFLGLANAIVWPAVWPLALSGLGKNTSTGSGLLLMGIAGGAFGPLFWGGLSSTPLGQQGGYIVLLPCYAFILFYALKGHKITAWGK
ncbi:L-fucose-proton symporter [Thalassocella blandensis]|nr:L-fucose-proton symporter [Thalassocella blandensis]